VAPLVQDRHRLREPAGALQPPDVGDGAVGGEELGELRDAALVEEDLLVGARLPRRPGQAALVAQSDPRPGTR